MKRQADLLKLLANPVRLCLLEKLIDEGECSVTSITSCMEVSQSAVSQHLRRLKDMGIVNLRKEENRSYYSCKRKDVEKIIRVLKESV
ncbi:metalloregulator ArsR/SmtB family transcription factor [uncultured Anaerococcus sp.]|uniref:ArsR/SmtB family transcription factor n=1 Tax=uncultured Anaerococcus sp. TaxID=293428 RepID=UPI003428CC9A